MVFGFKNQKTDNQQDDRVTTLENDAQERIKRIAGLRAQISNLTNEERKLQSEYDAVNQRVADLRNRTGNLPQLKEEETTLLREIKEREERQSALGADLEPLRETRRQLVQQISKLRAEVSNEESGAKKEREELARLEQILADNSAKRKEIENKTKTLQAAEESLKKEEDELNVLEEKNKELIERIPLTKKKYEETKQLVEELEKNTVPINQAIMNIWQQLPPDALDRLVIPQKNKTDS